MKKPGTEKLKWVDLGKNGVVILRWKCVQCSYFVLNMD